MFSLKPKYKMWRLPDQPIGTFVYFFWVHPELDTHAKHEQILKFASKRVFFLTFPSSFANVHFNDHEVDLVIRSWKTL